MALVIIPEIDRGFERSWTDHGLRSSLSKRPHFPPITSELSPSNKSSQFPDTTFLPTPLESCTFVQPALAIPLGFERQSIPKTRFLPGDPLHLGSLRACCTDGPTRHSCAA